jgi:hypothetical protein
MNATITVNIDDEAQSEYDEDFNGVNGFSTFEEMVAKVRRILRDEEADGNKVSSMVITLSF